MSKTTSLHVNYFPIDMVDRIQPALCHDNRENSFLQTLDRLVPLLFADRFDKDAFAVHAVMR